MLLFHHHHSLPVILIFFCPPSPTKQRPTSITREPKRVSIPGTLSRPSRQPTIQESSGSSRKAVQSTIGEKYLSTKPYVPKQREPPIKPTIIVANQKISQVAKNPNMPVWGLVSKVIPGITMAPNNIMRISLHKTTSAIANRGGILEIMDYYLLKQRAADEEPMIPMISPKRMFCFSAFIFSALASNSVTQHPIKAITVPTVSSK